MPGTIFNTSDSSADNDSMHAVVVTHDESALVDGLVKNLRVGDSVIASELDTSVIAHKINDMKLSFDNEYKTSYLSDSAVSVSVLKQDLLQLKDVSSFQLFVNDIDNIRTLTYCDTDTHEPIIKSHVSSVAFPAFWCTKQGAALDASPNILFERCGDFESSDLLRLVQNELTKSKPNSVALTGPPGHGKSVFVNLLLLKLLKLMRDSDHSLCVYYYIGMHMYLFAWGESRVVVSHCVETNSTDTIKFGGRKNNIDRIVVIVELSENETVDVEQLPTPFLLSLSNRDVHQTVKGAEKSGKFRMYVYPSCTWREIFAMGVVLLDAAGDAIHCRCPWTVTENGVLLSRKSALIQLIMTRIQGGSVPRLCFGSHQTYQHHLHRMQIEAGMCLAEIYKVSPYNIPDSASLFFGLRRSSSSNSYYVADCDIFVLSEYAAHQLATRINEVSQIRYLTDLNVYSSLVEAVVRQCLSISPGNAELEERTRYLDWMAYIDTGNRPLVADWHYSRTILSKLRVCKRTVWYSGRTPVCPSAVSMSEGVLYRPKVSEHRLFDFLFRIGRVVYLVQTSTRSPQKHSFSLHHVSSALDALGLRDSTDFKAVYLYVTDAVGSPTELRGLGLSYSDNDETHYIGLVEWRLLAAQKLPNRPDSSFEWILNRLHTVVVCAKFTSTDVRAVRHSSTLEVKHLKPFLEEVHRMPKARTIRVHGGRIVQQPDRHDMIQCMKAIFAENAKEISEVILK